MSSLITVLVLVEGPLTSKMVHLVVDSGATTTMISPHTAMAIGCEANLSEKHAPIITASGFVYMPLMKIPLIACLGVEIKNLEIICHQLPAESIVQGVLGLDFLRHVPAFQEFEKKILDLGKP